MTKEEINEFSKRIAQSNKTQLVAVTYDIILNYINSATDSLEEGSYRAYVQDLHKAQQLIDNLIASLDFKYELSYELLSLYGYANKCIAKSTVRKKNCDLNVVTDMMSKLKESFEKISNEDNSGTVMKGSGAVYAGLTYGKGDINEITDPGSTYN